MNEFSYPIDANFLAKIDGEHPTKADVLVKLQMIKSEMMYDLKFNLSGKVSLECDNCLDDFEMGIKGNYHLIMKISEVENYTDDEIIFIIPQLLEYDVTQYIYESFLLSIPAKRICALGNKECNKEFTNKLNELEQNDSEVDKKENDPRWDTLKGIINN